MFSPDIAPWEYDGALESLRRYSEVEPETITDTEKLSKIASPVGRSLLIVSLARGVRTIKIGRENDPETGSHVYGDVYKFSVDCEGKKIYVASSDLGVAVTKTTPTPRVGYRTMDFRSLEDYSIRLPFLDGFRGHWYGDWIMAREGINAIYSPLPVIDRDNPKPYQIQGYARVLSIAVTDLLPLILAQPQ